MPHDAWTTLFLQLAAMLAVGVALGQLARRAGLQPLFGELLGGVLLGPTVLGAIAPGIQKAIFPASGAVQTASSAIINLGMLLFLFTAGLEVDLEHLPRRARAIGWTSLCGIAVPMAAGVSLVWFYPGMWGVQATTQRGLVALCIGTALSISALPVIARILMDLDLLRHELGIVVMSAATLDDLIGWSLFAIVLSRFAGAGAPAGGVVAAIARTVGFIAATVVVGRLLGRPALEWIRRRLPWPTGFLAATSVLVLLAAATAELLGFHAVFGAFFAGVALAGKKGDANEAYATIQRFVLGFFSPLYFVSLGLLADFSRDFDLRLVAVVLGVACACKLGGAWVGARLARLGARDALAVAFGLNARGAMEMVIASVALQNGVIGPRVFVALIVMALVTSMISGPAISAILGRRKPATPSRLATSLDPADRVE